MSPRLLSLAFFSLFLTLPSSASATIKTSDFFLSQAQLDCLNAKITNGQALVAAMPVVYGSPRNFDCKEFATWKELAATPSVNMSAEMAAGLNFVQAVKFLRFELALSQNAAHRVQVVRDAIAEVYGREPSVPEMVGLQAQIAANTAWYAGIVSAEAKKLNNDKAARLAVIDRAYLKAMGRKSTSAEQATWLNRPEHYRLLVDAARQWMYSPQGAEDLKQTIVRALGPDPRQGGRPQRAFGPAEINAAIAKFTPEKQIYSEMR